MRTRVLIIGLLAILILPATSAGFEATPSVVDRDDGKQTFSFKITDIQTEERLYLIDEERAFDFSDVSVSVTGDRSYTVAQDVESTNRLSVDPGQGADPFYINLTTTPKASADRPFQLNVSDDTYDTELYFDDEPPQITGLTPPDDTTDQTHFETDIEATIEDAGIGLDTDTLDLTINGDETPYEWDGSDDELTAEEIALDRGENTIAITAADSYNHSQTTTWTVHVAEAPLIEEPAPDDLIDDQQPQIELSVTDPAGIDWDETTLTINDDKTVDHTFNRFSYEHEHGNTYDISYDTTEHQSDGTQTIDATITATSGEEREYQWEYTVDSTEPVIEETSLRDGELHQDDLDVWVEAEDDESGITETELIIDDHSYELDEDAFNRYEDTIDTTDLPDGEQSVTYVVRDEAGNEARETREITLDNTAPTIETISVFPDPTTTAPELTVEATDDATEITRVEYFIEDDPGEGDGTALSHEETGFDTDEYTTEIPIEDRENGYVPVSVRARDKAQHWSTVETHQFELNRSLTTGLSIETTAQYNITQGTTETIAIEVFNTGDIAEKTELTADDSTIDHITPTSHIIQPGTSRIFETTISIGSNHSLGETSIPVTASSPASRQNTTMTVMVEPDNQTREQLETRLKTLKERLETIRAEKNEWEPYLDDRHREKTQQKLETTENEIQEIEKALADGEYLSLHKNQGQVETLVEQTDQAIDDGVETYQRVHRNRQILLAILILIGVGAVGIRYQYGEKSLKTTTRDGYQQTQAENTEEPITDGLATLRIAGRTVVTNTERQIQSLIQQAKTFQDDDDDENPSWSGYEQS